jgi:hypothetical protein
MPTTPHIEKHFTASETIRDIIDRDGLGRFPRREERRGGLIPLLPYFPASSAKSALPLSVVFTLIALLIFGYVKGRFTGAKPIRSAIQTMLIGGVAAAAAFTIARLIS